MSNPTTDSSHHQNYHITITAAGSQNFGGQSPTENSGKLKVEDALKYIDRVKERFNEDIYKKFLEVMKDFKAQKINTESVIQNVLSLFDGHQDLIEGFNTFLPPGYQMSSYQNQVASGLSDHGIISGIPLNSSLTTVNNQSYAAFSNSVVKGQGDMSIINETVHDGISMPKDKSEISQVSILPSSNSSQFNIKSMSAGLPQQTPNEFNHAVEYVNKIKNRFQKQPDVYKRFLEILHWYQKEQKNPDVAKRKQTENEVSQEVAKLFDNEHDLLQEFSTFLPDSVGIGNNLGENDMQPSRRTSSGFKSIGGSSQAYSINVSTSSNVFNVNDKTKFQNLASSKLDILNDSNEKESSEYYRPVPAPVCLTPSSTSQIHKRNLVQDLTSDRRLSNIPPSKRLRTSSSTISNKESIRMSVFNNPELGKYRFFNIIYSMCQELLELPQESAYYSFINTVDLFNQQIIDAEQLKAAIKPFFSKRSETWQSFLNLIDKISENERIYSVEGNCNSSYLYDIRRVNSPSSIQNLKECDSNLIINSQVTANSIGNNTLIGNITSCQTIFWRKNIELSKLEICGSHYRVLPEEFTEARSAIQMKNKLCKEVLNYNFLCHRSLSAEDAPFVFSKKNAYEESVFKNEDERYEIDMVMEVNKAAMVRLADLQIRLKEMTPDQIKDFNFEENLYKSSTILFYKAVQRIYGDKAHEIINGLKSHPLVVVPIVLGRLKEKDSEWKEKVKLFRRHWRDQDQNLLKSLDYQAINFRTKDASLTRHKSLLCQLDSVVKSKVLYLNNYQDKNSINTLIDSLLTIKRTWKLDKPDKWGSNAYGNGGVIEFNEKIFPQPDYHLLLLFPCDAQYAKSILDYPFQPKMYLFDKLDWYELLSDASSLIIYHLKRQSNYTKDDKTNMKLLMRIALQDIFIDDRFQMSDDEDDSTEGNNNVESEHSGISNRAMGDKEKNYKVFLGNKQWYIFIRLYHVLIDRLAALKIKGEQLLSRYKEEKKQNTLEVADLLLYKKSGQQNPANYYQAAINLLKDLLDSCEDTSNFEDKMREMYNIHAYIWFSMDKVIANIVRQLQMISCADNFSRKLTSLFRQCSKPFFGKDEQNNTLRIISSGTGTRVDARTEDIINDEYEYMQAASRLSVHYKQPLVVMLFHRNPLIKYCGHMSICLLDIPPPNSSESESQEENTPIKDEPVSSAPGKLGGRKYDGDMNNFQALTWRGYMERYVNCSEKLGFADGLHNLSLDKRTSVPVFLLRSLRRSISIISKQNFEHIPTEDIEDKLQEESYTPEKLSLSAIDWHTVIVQLIANIFDRVNESNLHTFLKNTIMTGHMCPVAEEGHNLMMQYAAAKLTWSVGSCGIFCRIKRNAKDLNMMSKRVNNLRRHRFMNFQNLWLSKQS